MRLSNLTKVCFGQREKLWWLAGGCVALTLILLSCSSFESGRAIMAPPSIPGAEFVGSEECATCHDEIVRDFRTASHARLKTEGANAKSMGCESCHGPGSLHVQGGGDRSKIINPRKSATACFACHTDVRSSFELPHHHPVIEGKVSCTDCHNPHKGDAVKGGGTNMPQGVKGGGIAMLGPNGACLQCHTAQRGPFVFEHEAIREGCITCHTPHGSVNQKLLAQRSSNLCLKCHFQQQTSDGKILIGDGDHTGRLQQGTCWSAGCHEAVHGSQVNTHFRY